MNIDEVEPRAFAMPLAATHSVAGMILGPGKVVYDHLDD
jgi:acetoacetate decarboxylase